MPFTPFHLGPGAVIHAAAPRQVSFIAFGIANVLIDIEPLYYMLTQQGHLHRFFHTLVGASVVALATVALFLACRWFARRFWLPNFLQWQGLQLLPVAFGAALGTFSHIVLDSLMHRDITPFAPFSTANPLLGVVSLRALHWLCLGAGMVGLAVLGIRRLVAGSR